MWLPWASILLASKFFPALTGMFFRGSAQLFNSILHFSSCVGEPYTALMPYYLYGFCRYEFTFGGDICVKVNMEWKVSFLLTLSTQKHILFCFIWLFTTSKQWIVQDVFYKERSLLALLLSWQSGVFVCMTAVAIVLHFGVLQHLHINSVEK